MKRTVVMFLLGMIMMETMAQQDPKFSQNMFLAPMFNPGSVGLTDKICVGAAFRNQWTGSSSAPTSTTFSADAPLNFLGRTHGLGVTVLNDKLAFENDLTFRLAYSYQLDIGKGKLGIGLNAGLLNYSFKPEWVGAGEIDPFTDDYIPQQDASLFGFDMGLGVFYRTETYYAGLSTTHPLEWTFKFPEELAEYRLTRHYYAMAGYTIQLPNPMIEIMPSFMVMSGGNMNLIYLNTNVRYNKRFWGGVSYSIGESIIILAGIDLMNGAKIGYSYDISTSSIFKYSSGSHELTVRYCFDMSLDKTPQKYKSIRIM